MSLSLTGTLIVKEDIQYVRDKFQKRNFVIELSEDINGKVYKNYAKLQLVQNKCDMLDKFNIGDNITVDFNVKGNKWEKDGKTQYITNLDCWRISLANATPTPVHHNPDAMKNSNPYGYDLNPTGGTDDLPF